MSEYTSVFGVTRVFGLGEGADESNKSTSLGMEGIEHTLVAKLTATGPDFNKDADNDGTKDSFGRGVANIPAGAVIVSAEIAVRSFEGAGNVTVGLYKKDGTEIDADGLFANKAIATGLLTGEGALVGESVGNAAGYLKVTGNEGLINPDADIVVKYIL